MDIAPQLETLLGKGGWLGHESDTAPYVRDWLDRYGVQPIGVARPADTEQVAETIKLCRKAGVTVVPQGGGTGLVGGSVAADPNTVILSMSRMNTIEIVDEHDFCVVVQAGTVLAALHDTLEKHDLTFPMHLGAEGSAQIGGLIATNAGGSHAFRFGTMMDLVLGLEVVLPDGQIWNGTRRLVKDNAGLQLRRLFCGSEGRLGIVTRAALRVYPVQKSHATALVALPDAPAMIKLGQILRRTCGEFLTGLEFFDNGTLELALHHVRELAWPMQTRAPWYVLVDLATSIDQLDLQSLLETALMPLFEENLALDAVIAQSEAQRSAIWQIREELPEGSRREGPQIKHDIAVPISNITVFLEKVSAEIDAILPGVRIWSFGHLADGNIHFNLSPPISRPDFDEKELELSMSIYRSAEEIGGTMAAEHGLGRSKKAIADQLRPYIERELMAKVQEAIDPTGLMNKGVSI